MSGYTNNFQDNAYYWNSQGNPQSSPLMSYDEEYNQMQNQPLMFSSTGEYTDQSTPHFEPVSFASKTSDDLEEPPLLEELEIFPDRIAQKILAVLNPFRSHALTDDAEYLTKDPDLAGPVTFYLVLAVCLFLGGNRTPFGYIYGITVLSCVLMYCLLTLMNSGGGVFSLTSVGSILGYSMIPIVGLSFLGIFLTLTGPVGILLAALSVLWSSASASRLFTAVSGDKEQQVLTAYPCALVSGVYVLLVIF